MNICTDDITTDHNYVSLELLLGNRTIPEIKNIARLLSIHFKSSPKKAQMVKALSKYMLDNPSFLIKRSFYHELKAWLNIMEGRMSMDQAKKEGYLFMFNKFSMVYSFKRDEPNIFFQRDMAERLRPLSPHELERREKDGSLLMEKAAFGCANIYGWTATGNMLDYEPEIRKKLGFDLSESFLTKALYPMLAECHGA